MKSRNLAGAMVLGAILWLSGCSDDTTAPGNDMVSSRPADRGRHPGAVVALAAEVRQLAAAAGITPLARPAPVRPELFRLGQVLAFDKILSGNRDISCMTCHLPKLGTADGRSVAIGQGGTGLGTGAGASAEPLRPPQRARRSSICMRWTTLTWDGRVFRDPTGVIRTPGANLLAVAARAAGVRHRSPRCRCCRCCLRAEMRGDSAIPATSWRRSPTTITRRPGGS